MYIFRDVLPLNESLVRIQDHFFTLSSFGSAAKPEHGPLYAVKRPQGTTIECSQRVMTHPQRWLIVHLLVMRSNVAN
jgi:hypothetical protein